MSHSLQHEVTTRRCLEDMKTQEFREFFAWGTEIVHLCYEI